VLYGSTGGYRGSEASLARVQAMSRHLSSSAVGLPCSSAVTEVVAGGTAGVLAWASIYPVDVVKCRLQACGQARLWDVWCQVHTGGARMYCQGLVATLVRAFVVNGALFCGVATAHRFLGS
jgi:hypothetical protein